MKTVCVTGHRPAKLPWGYKKEGPDYDEYIESLACTIADYLENGYDHFITGMALGVDMDFAETVIQFREHYDLDVKLECAIPCPNQTLKWSPTETARYKEILEKADKVTLYGRPLRHSPCRLEWRAIWRHLAHHSVCQSQW